MHLIIQYFNDKNKERKEEYDKYWFVVIRESRDICDVILTTVRSAGDLQARVWLRFLKRTIKHNIINDLWWHGIIAVYFEEYKMRVYSTASAK